MRNCDVDDCEDCVCELAMVKKYDAVKMRTNKWIKKREEELVIIARIWHDKDRIMDIIIMTMRMTIM